jgi:hypothetical protein
VDGLVRVFDGNLELQLHGVELGRRQVGRLDRRKVELEAEELVARGAVRHEAVVDPHHDPGTLKISPSKKSYSGLTCF